MKKLLNYSTKYIDDEIKRRQSCLESAKHESRTGMDYREILYQRLDQRMAEQAYDWVINSLCDLFFEYAQDGDIRMQLDVDAKAAKESYYIAALIGVLCYEMIEKGFTHKIISISLKWRFLQMNTNWH